MIGLSDPHDKERFIDDLILSCNLVLDRAAFSKNSTDSTRSIMEKRKRFMPKPKTENTESGKKVIVSDALHLDDSVDVVVGIEDKLDEAKVLELLSKILILKNCRISPSLQVSNMKKSLIGFQAAMSCLDMLETFKQLSSSLEISTNYDGIDRKNQKLVQEASRVSGVAYSKINDCREFYNRTKHSNRNLREEMEYQDGLKPLDEKIGWAREAAQKIIAYRLRSLCGTA